MRRKDLRSGAAEGRKSEESNLVRSVPPILGRKTVHSAATNNSCPRIGLSSLPPPPPPPPPPEDLFRALPSLPSGSVSTWKHAFFAPSFMQAPPPPPIERQSGGEGGGGGSGRERRIGGENFSRYCLHSAYAPPLPPLSFSPLALSSLRLRAHQSLTSPSFLLSHPLLCCYTLFSWFFPQLGFDDRKKEAFPCHVQVLIVKA